MATANFEEGFRKKLKEISKRDGWTQEILADYLGINQSDVSRMINSKSQIRIQLDTLPKIAELDNISVEELMRQIGYEPDDQPPKIRIPDCLFPPDKPKTLVSVSQDILIEFDKIPLDDVSRLKTFADNHLLNLNAAGEWNTVFKLIDRLILSLKIDQETPDNLIRLGTMFAIVVGHYMKSSSLDGADGNHNYEKAEKLTRYLSDFRSYANSNLVSALCLCCEGQIASGQFMYKSSYSDLRIAHHKYVEALSLFKRDECPDLWVMIACKLANTLRTMDEYEEAIEYYKEVYPQGLIWNMRAWYGVRTGNMGIVKHRQGELDKSLELLHECTRQLTELVDFLEIRTNGALIMLRKAEKSPYMRNIYFEAARIWFAPVRKQLHSIGITRPFSTEQREVQEWFGYRGVI